MATQCLNPLGVRSLCLSSVSPRAVSVVWWTSLHFITFCAQSSVLHFFLVVPLFSCLLLALPFALPHPFHLYFLISCCTPHWFLALSSVLGSFSFVPSLMISLWETLLLFIGEKEVKFQTCPVRNDTCASTEVRRSWQDEAKSTRPPSGKANPVMVTGFFKAPSAPVVFPPRSAFMSEFYHESCSPGWGHPSSDGGQILAHFPRTEFITLTADCEAITSHDISLKNFRIVRDIRQIWRACLFARVIGYHLPGRRPYGGSTKGSLVFMGWRGKDRFQGMESDLAIQEAPGKKMPGKKAICVRHSKCRGCPLCVWLYGGLELVCTALTLETVFNYLWILAAQISKVTEKGIWRLADFYIFIQQIIIKPLLCVRHCFWQWEYSSEQNTISILKELIFSCRRQITSPQTNKYTITTVTLSYTTLTKATSISVLLLMIINI